MAFSQYAASHRHAAGVIILFASALLAQQPAAPQAARSYRQQHAAEILKDFAALLAMPNVAQANDEARANIQRNAEYLQKQFEQRGVKTQLLTVAQGSPVVYGELPAAGATRTVIFYAHYDGQPVQGQQWITPPFQPVLRQGANISAAEVSLSALPPQLPPDSSEWRIYGRSTSDDKGTIQAFLSALDALQAGGVKSSINLKFFLEGEEEAGSPHLGEILDKYKDLLKADLWLLCDGPRHQSGKMQLVYGARGSMGLEMTTFGPSRALHSGHYGNWAPNPAMELAHLLAAMRSTEGHILIPGFYHAVRPLSAAEKSALASVPDVDQQLATELALTRTEGSGRKLKQLITEPALNVRGLRAGEVGAAAANAIMTQASASIDFRLVPNQTPAQVQQQVETFLRGLGYFMVHDPPDAATRRAHAKLVMLQWEGGYPAARAGLDSPLSRAVVKTMEGVAGAGRLVRLPTLGGSVPMYLFQEKLATPALIVPIANYDNNQHSANENLRLQNLWDGIELYAALFADLGKN